MQHENVLKLNIVPNPTIRIESKTLLLAEHVRDTYPDDWEFISNSINRAICEYLLDFEYYRKKREYGITR